MPESYVTNQTEKGNICISEDVLCRMVQAAVSEVDGVAGLSSALSTEVTEFLGIKSLPKGIKVSAQDGKIIVDVLLMVRYGYSVADVAQKAQESVFAAVESMTGMKVAAVHVDIVGIAQPKA